MLELAQHETEWMPTRRLHIVSVEYKHACIHTHTRALIAQNVLSHGQKRTQNRE